MKRTRVPYGESVFIGGRRCRISQSKGGGVNLYTDEDCPVVVGEASEVVDCREATLGEEMVAGLEQLRDELESGKPIEAKRLKWQGGRYVTETVVLSKKARE